MARFPLSPAAAMTAILCLAGCQNPPGPVGPWDGFEGVRWGQLPAGVPWLVKQGDHHVPNAHPVTLAGIPATRAQFTFSPNLGFADVELLFNGRKNFEAARQYLVRTYGPGTATPLATRERPSAEGYLWDSPAASGKAVGLSLLYDPETDECRFFMGNAKMIEIPY